MQPLNHFLITQNLSPQLLKTLQERWNNLGKKINLPITKQTAYFELIQKYYSEKHRTYHNLSHLYSLFSLKDTLLKSIENELVIDLSIWFHDIIYRSTRRDNEKKSAELFRKLMSPYLPKATVETVHTYIVSTAAHQPQIPDLDNQIFLDLDLGILAAKEETYLCYTQAIRKEYKIFPKLLYQAGRKEVMQQFLARENIYFSSYFECFEPIAKANIQNEILHL